MIVDDRFSESVRPGRVIGSRTPQHVMRQGIDVERIISIDHNALRIAPPIQAGWGRASIAYGPFERHPGLAFAVFMLNGHNTSQLEPLGQGYIFRIAQWLLGHQPLGIRAAVARGLDWLRYGNKGDTLREFRWWWQLNRSRVKLDENLALGWFTEAVPTDPRAQGNAFVMHAAETECGELWTRAGSGLLPVVKGVQNLPIYYVVVLREQGAVYYAASVEGVRGLAGYPYLRPLAVDTTSRESMVYAGLNQSVLGQIGFRADSRVYGASVAHIPEYSQWYTTAQVADRLAGTGTLAKSPAECGGTWQVYRGAFQRGEQGMHATEADSLAVLYSDEPSGLVCATFDMNADSSAAGLVWRLQDDRNYWQITLRAADWEIAFVEEGMSSQVASGACPESATVCCLQILDDGQTMMFSVNGVRLLQKPLADSRLQGATGSGVWAAESGERPILSAFEAHPLAIRLPAVLDLGEPWLQKGSQAVLHDDFSGEAGAFDGRMLPAETASWRHEIGHGQFDLTGSGSVRVRGDVQEPNPGRTAYTLPWNNPHFADLEVTITPPGTQRGQGERGRSGLIIWQDYQHYFILNTWLDDVYGGASISTFFHIDGFEDLYRAIWTNVGDRVVWGKPYNLRLVFDGIHYMAFVNGEPVLYRALTDVFPRLATPLTINRVGIAANWEWGDDTGSEFSDFVARD